MGRTYWFVGRRGEVRWSRPPHDQGCRLATARDSASIVPVNRRDSHREQVLRITSTALPPRVSSLGTVLGWRAMLL